MRVDINICFFDKGLRVLIERFFQCYNFVLTRNCFNSIFIKHNFISYMRLQIVHLYLTALRFFYY